MNNWDQLINDYNKYLYNRGSSGHTITAYIGDISAFIYFLKNNFPIQYEIGEISQESAQSFIHLLIKKGMKDVTIARKIDSLRGFYDYLLSALLVQQNPFIRIKYPKIIYNHINSLSKDEIIALFKLRFRSDYIGLRDRAILYLFYATGLRLSELTALNLSDISFENDLIIIKNKEINFRESTLGELFIPSYYSYIKERAKKIKFARGDSDSKRALFLSNQGKRLTERSVGRIVSSYLKRISPKGKLSSHSLRSSFAKHLLDSGERVSTVQKLMAHSSPLTTYKYFPKRYNQSGYSYLGQSQYDSIKQTLIKKANPDLKIFAEKVIDYCWNIDQCAVILRWRDDNDKIISFSIPPTKAEGARLNYFSFYKIVNLEQDFIRCEFSVAHDLVAGFIKEYDLDKKVTFSKYRRRLQGCFRSQDLELLLAAIKGSYNNLARPEFLLY